MTGSITVLNADYLRVVVYDGVVSDREFRKHLKDLGAQLTAQRSPVAVILESSRAGFTPATQRREQAAWLERHRTALEETCLGTAVVVDSPMVRGLLTAVLWLAPLPGTHTLVPTYQDAEDWAFGRIRDAGFRPPMSLAHSLHAGRDAATAMRA